MFIRMHILCDDIDTLVLMIYGLTFKVFLP